MVASLLAASGALLLAPSALAYGHGYGYGNPDPCVKIAGKAYAPPADVMACFRSFPYNETLKANVLDVVSKTLNFFTFEAEQLHAPAPFRESSVNLRGELARMAKQTYSTDYDFNRDLYNVINALNDGHTQWEPSCYWDAYQNILPAPVQSLSVNGKQNIYIAQDTVAFLNQLGPDFLGYFQGLGFNWQQYAGSKVLAIGGKDAYAYVDEIASTYTGEYLDHGVRVNSVFSSYRLANGTWSQRLGDLAGPIFPDLTHLDMTLIRPNCSEVEHVRFPYLASYISSAGNFTDGPSYYAINCAVQPTTNGINYLDPTSLRHSSSRLRGFSKAQRKVAKIHDVSLSKAVGLPGPYLPQAPNVTISDAVKSYVLPDSNVGVIMVGTFEPANYTRFQIDVLTTLAGFKAKNVEKVIVDVTDNGGGYICLGEFLHLALVGADFGYGGFQATNRVNPLAIKIVENVISLNLANFSYYAPNEFAFPNGTAFPSNYNYMLPPVNRTINGISEPVSQRQLDVCTPWGINPPKTSPFKPENIVIVGNGNCASTCAQFTTVMHERHNTRMVVFGGKPDEPLEYKGMAGNQVLEWADIDSEIKTAQLKNDSMAPPDLLVNGNIRVNWRTAYSWQNEDEAIAFRAERAQYRYPYTPETVNNPEALWNFVAKELFEDSY